jgi:hypothetical protein
MILNYTYDHVVRFIFSTSQTWHRGFMVAVLLLGLQTAAYSQSDFRKGFVIRQKSDTAFGFIDYHESSRAYRFCDFKRSEKDAVISYEPGEIAAYGFLSDRFFESRPILKDDRREQVFVQVLVKGEVSLYEFDARFLVEKGEQELEPLLNEGKELYLEDGPVIKYSNQHIATLSILLFDCPEVRSALQDVQLLEKSLTTLIVDYNKCKGVEPKLFKERKPWVKALIGIEGGVNASWIDFDGEAWYSHLLGSFETAISPTVGLSATLLSPRLSEHFAFQAAAIFMRTKYYNYKYVDRGSSTKIDYVTIDLQQLKLPIGFQYVFFERTFTPYLMAGPSFTLHVASNSTWIQELESGNLVRTQEGEALSIKSSQFGVWAGIGISRNIHHKLSAYTELRYEQTRGIASSIYPDLRSNISNFQVNLGIRTR